MFVDSEFFLPLTQPLLVRPIHDLGLLPAGITAELPREIALSVVRRKLAIPVGDLNAMTDVTVDDNDVESVFGAAFNSAA